MKPFKFKEQNFTLTRPYNMTEGECSSLPAYRCMGRIISCWKMSLLDRIRAVLFGKIWVDVRSGESQPPMALLCCRTAFDKRKGKP